MPSNARNLANLLGAGEATISAEKLGNDVPPGTEDYSSIDSLGVGTTVGETAFIEGSNRLYIWNGSGWYNIALINTTPTWDSGGQPEGSYVLDADSPQDATIITLAASDPEGLPISYNYITSGSMDSIATISQDSSVFTITPKTSVQAPDGGTGSITFRATDGINILPQVSSFTLNFVTLIENSRYTTLLATATGGSDNNNITDASTNNHSITVGADAHAGTFSPYRSGGYSMYFDGGDYVDLGNGNLAIDTEDFTIETWVNVTIGSNIVIATNSNWSAGDNTGWRLFIAASGIINLTASQGSWNSYPSIYASTNTISSNEWAHIVVCRNSGVISSYINGIKDPTTVNYSASLNQTGGSALSSYSLIGAYIADGVTYNTLTGYLSDFHFKLGSAKYTTTFSPPTERLTVESGTDVLLFNKPFLKDESTNAYTTTISGDPKISPFSPYDYNEYSATDHGGSVYFDGTGDYLSISNQGISGDLTYEGWFYQTAAQSATYRVLISSSTYASGVPLRVYTNNTNIQVWTSGSGGAEITEAFEPYTWFHIAIVRSSGTWTLYVNGESAGTTTVGGTYNFASTTGWSVGGSQTGSYPFTGYASDVKLTNSAVYSSNFTPSTSPLSSSGAELHIKGTDASIIDKSQTTNIKLVGGTNGTTTQAKFANTRSMYFDESGDHIDVSEGFIPLRTSDFTIETWFYPTASPSSHEGIFSNGTHNSGNWLALLYLTSRIIRYDIGGGSSSNLSTTAVSLNTWCHIALCRSGGNIRLYINGTQEHTEANSSDLNYETARIGDRIGLTNRELNSAYLQDFRITKGLARYTANFTPPTASLEG